MEVKKYIHIKNSNSCSCRFNETKVFFLEKAVYPNNKRAVPLFPYF